MCWNRKVVVIAVAGLLSACGEPLRPVADAGADPQARAAIEAANAATAAAVADDDARAVVAHYAEDALLLPAGADAVSGPRAIERHFRRALDAGLRGLELEILSLDVAGDLAVETGTYQARDGRGTRIDQGKYVVAWRRGGDGWKAYRDIATSSLPATAAPGGAEALPARCDAGDGVRAPPASG